VSEAEVEITNADEEKPAKKGSRRLKGELPGGPSLTDEPRSQWCETCGKRTSHGKPFCAKHVFSMPYVARLRVTS
jgi:hypothetical protein